MKCHNFLVKNQLRTVGLINNLIMEVWPTGLKEGQCKAFETTCEERPPVMISNRRPPMATGTNDGCLSEDLALVARLEQVVRCILKMSVRECRDADIHARKFNRSCAQKKTKRRSEVRFNDLHQHLNCSPQCHPLN